MKNFEEKYKLIVKIGNALHKFGCSSLRVETYIQDVAKHIGVEVSCQVTTNTLNYQIEDPETNERQVILQYIPLGSNDLGKLADLHKRLRQAFKDDHDYETITKNIDEVMVSKKLYGELLLAFAYTVIPPSFLALIGGSIITLLFSFLMGFLGYVITKAVGKFNTSKYTLEFYTAFICSMMGCLCKCFIPELDVIELSLASIILYVPGLTISIALEEISFNQFNSGTGFLFNAVMIFLKLFIGVYLGMSVGNYLFDLPEDIYVNEIPKWGHYIALPFLSIGLGIVFNTKFKDMMIGLVLAAIAFWGPMVFTNNLGWIFGTFISAFLITFLSIVVSRWRDVPPSVYLLQGIVILVPGSRLFMGLSNQFNDDPIIDNPSIGTSGLLMFCAIVVGMLVAYSTYYPNLDNRNEVV
ncbi:threonine/serine exporter family protein [Flammeovirga agarivorans]|uniref:Threonine/serine exporter family protein n=1 Tax=Flammeovirga agarivorans TaxID=2726742 RepID=A0A7X8SJ10_9BACT|nr:threonine/serine exporter family protein [Flammeovirga agarivorans]NLR91121.1 threonine/serine exporter family protein [Flammeovirga agarivorans]